jgi:hypothetical protein
MIPITAIFTFLLCECTILPANLFKVIVTFLLLFHNVCILKKTFPILWSTAKQGCRNAAISNIVWSFSI